MAPIRERVSLIYLLSLIIITLSVTLEVLGVTGEMAVTVVTVVTEAEVEAPVVPQ